MINQCPEIAAKLECPFYDTNLEEENHGEASGGREFYISCHVGTQYDRVKRQIFDQTQSYEGNIPLSARCPHGVPTEYGVGCRDDQLEPLKKKSEAERPVPPPSNGNDKCASQGITESRRLSGNVTYTAGGWICYDDGTCDGDHRTSVPRGNPAASPVTIPLHSSQTNSGGQ